MSRDTLRSTSQAWRAAMANAEARRLRRALDAYVGPGWTLTLQEADDWADRVLGWLRLCAISAFAALIAALILWGAMS